jgi:hypothetical protein
MTPRRLLVLLSTAQLAAGVAGLVVAVRRRRPYDLPFLSGPAQHVARDSLWMGTAYSAPLPMLLGQAFATANLWRGPDDGARRMLGMLGVVMVPGYLLERSGRRHLSVGGLDPVETPVVVAGTALAAAMGVLGHREASGG